ARDEWDKTQRRPNAEPGGSARPAAKGEAGFDVGRRGLPIGAATSADLTYHSAGCTDPVSVAIQETASGTSIFDPVLCEIAYRWFSPPSGLVLDPFAGGSVRGIVAAKLGRAYVGIDLSGRQLEANRRQAEQLLGPEDPAPRWIEGDSRELGSLPGSAVEADLIFSCPPYADLEVYSDNPLDLSTMPWAEFRVAYRECIANACERLRSDRFACFVVGEVRDRRGNYIDFVGETVQAFRDAGLEFYNEAILITAAGSLPIRAGKQFSASRKLGKTHQNILVFLKGNAKKAVAACGPVEVDHSLFEPEDEKGAGQRRPL
ncbi:MAG: DNA methyltransferase, partial [Allosphingosinicella sp.]